MHSYHVIYNYNKLTYSALRDLSCWKVLDSILLILLCCRPLGVGGWGVGGIAIHEYSNAKKHCEYFGFWCMHVHIFLSREVLLTSLEVRSSNKNWADPLFGCETAPCNTKSAHTQSTHKHSDQMWIYSVGNYGGDRIIWVNSWHCEQSDIVGR